MQSLQTLRRRIRSIKSTGQITNAMEMVAASKLRRAEQTWNNSLTYFRELRRVMVQMLFSGSNPEEVAAYKSPYLQSNGSGKDCLVVVSSDRGLCGGYNTNIERRAEDFINRQDMDRNIVLYCIGQRCVNYFSRRSYSIIGRRVDISSPMPDFFIGEDIISEMESLYLSGKISSLHLLFGRYISRIHQYPHIDKILPLSDDLLEAAEFRGGSFVPAQYIIEPDFKTLMDKIIPTYVHTVFNVRLLESLTAEHSARMVSMTNATRNCEGMIQELTLQLNKARQASITRELLDIVGGAGALQ
jgi:F-type H+-transporting ATPase subunit gamma